MNNVDVSSFNYIHKKTVNDKVYETKLVQNLSSFKCMSSLFLLFLNTFLQK